ncbi:MAG: hypothetical protein RBT34_04275, partial [Anaerolineaceae bacterium]|nr:hypothetical protein [Anaerolineaceae bacterium]
MTKKALRIFGILTSLLILCVILSYVVEKEYPLGVKMLETAMAIFVASLCILICITVWEQKKVKFLPFLGMTLSIISSILISYSTWTDNYNYAFSIISGGFTIFTLVTIHLCLLSLANLSKKFRWALWAAYIVNYGFAALFILMLPSPFEWILLILALLLPAISILILIFHTLSVQERRIPIQVLCPCCRVEQNHLAGKMKCENCHTEFEVKIIKIGENNAYPKTVIETPFFQEEDTRNQEEKMKKSEAISLAQNRSSSLIYKETIHFANINSSKEVWWLDIPRSKIFKDTPSSINLLLFDDSSKTLYHLEVPNAYFSKIDQRLACSKEKDCYSLELSSRHNYLFQDIRPTGG